MDTKKKIANLEDKIRTIEDRNKRVEADKAWETSWTRRILVALLTYFLIVLFFFVNNFPSPWENALVPTLGFILSTLTLNLFKQIWLKFNKS